MSFHEIVRPVAILPGCPGPNDHLPKMLPNRRQADRKESRQDHLPAYQGREFNEQADIINCDSG